MDWTGNQYIGITLNWDYKQQQVHLSMPNYVKKALKLFQHKVRKEKHSPHPCTPIIYREKVQYAKQAVKSPMVNAKTKKFI